MNHKVFIGYSHLLCNLHSAKPSLFYWHKNGLLYYACKDSEGYKQYKNKLAAWKVNLVYPIRGCSRSESGLETCQKVSFH